MLDEYSREEMQRLDSIPKTITMLVYLIIQMVTKCPITFGAPKANVSVKLKLGNAISQGVKVQDLDSLLCNHLQTLKHLQIPNN